MVAHPNPGMAISANTDMSIAEDKEVNSRCPIGNLLNWTSSGLSRNKGKTKMVGAGSSIHKRNKKPSKPVFIDDIMTCIFPRLPVRSLGTCKTVSKGWRKLICSPHFVGLQLSWSKKMPNYIVYAYGHEILIFYMMNADGEIFEEIKLPGLENVLFPRVICSYNGLICCINDASHFSDGSDIDIRICNPATRVVFLLPKGSPSKEVLSIGVAFSHGMNEYKVFRFFRSGCESEGEHYECEIYSSISRMWRGMGIVEVYPMGFNYKCSMGFNHVCVDGKLYWFICSDSEDEGDVPGSILSVDMDENFQRISLPDSVILTHHSYLVEIEGLLSLIAMDEEFDKVMSIWVLQDSVGPTWVEKWSTVSPKFDYECINSVAVRANEIFISTTESCYIFNMDKETWRGVQLANLDGDSTVVFTFTESLLPCNGVL